MFESYENFSDEQKKILEKYVSNTNSSIFALKNLPEVIKGALFSRYSRSNLGLRSLLLKEFIGNTEESEFALIAGDGANPENQILAIQKAQNFYDRILDGYGDDSIGELGGAHLAIENISMLAAKVIEDARIGGSPLEKSTRYIYFDQKVNGEYLFYREPILMTSAFRDAYLNTCNHLFETYSKLIPPLTVHFEERFPHDPSVSKVAYTAAVRAKVLDCLRGLLPASTLTNMGAFGNGRFYEQLLHKLHCNSLAELQEIGKKMQEELGKIIPSFVRRANLEHNTHKRFNQFYGTMETELAVVTKEHTNFSERSIDPGVRLLSYDNDAVIKVAAALLYANSNKGLYELYEYCKRLPDEEIARILDAGCAARENRRHKSPRALEQARFSFEIIADFGVYRDLQRHRLFSQERQLLSCDYGYNVPDEIVGTAVEADYHLALQKAKQVYDTIATDLPEEAQYVVPMAYNIRWYMEGNLRLFQWMCELRSSAAGHPNYRYIAQSMAKQICQTFPIFERFFKFVDYNGYDIGRMGQEQRKIEKQMKASK
ncbi:FAD-dependent thymidylate synthase [Candidatus Rubidus massiliensis]|nr:MAG: hypothetical protein BGO10_08035 [Chlamydia sp. 32-24]CDZ79724.1 FAD-dependent thymidylate synthase [Candidatus Rubidus massiliensis]